MIKETELKKLYRMIREYEYQIEKYKKEIVAKSINLQKY